MARERAGRDRRRRHPAAPHLRGARRRRLRRLVRHPSCSARRSRRRATSRWCRAPLRASASCGTKSGFADSPRSTERHESDEMRRLKDKVAIITGAGQGIGEAYARRFAQEGATVVVADINAEKGTRGGGAIGGDAVFERVDVSSEEDTKRLAKAVVDRFGRIDVLINNAAIFYGIDNFDSTLRVPAQDLRRELLRHLADVPRRVPVHGEAGGGVGDQPVVERRLHAPEHPDAGRPLPSFHYSVTKAAHQRDDALHGRLRRRLRHPRQRHRPGPDAHRGDQAGRAAQSILEMIINMHDGDQTPLEPGRPHRHGRVARLRRLEDGHRAGHPGRRRDGDARDERAERMQPCDQVRAGARASYRSRRRTIFGLTQHSRAISVPSSAGSSRSVAHAVLGRRRRADGR